MNLDMSIRLIGFLGVLISAAIVAAVITIIDSDWRWRNREWARRHLPDVRWH